MAEIGDIAHKILSAVSEDRDQALRLLEDVESHLKDESDYATLGHIAATYLTKAQKSVDQLLTLAEILRKASKDGYEGLDNLDIEAVMRGVAAAPPSTAPMPTPPDPEADDEQ